VNRNPLAGLLSRVTIRWKLILIALVTTIVVLLAVAAAIFTYDSVTFRQALVAETNVLAQMLEVSCAQAVVFGDQEGAEEALSTLRAQGQVVAAAVYGRSGEVFAKYVRQGAGDWRPPPRQPAGHRFEGDRLSLFHSMEYGRKEVGAVHVLLEMGALRDRQRAYAKLLSVTLLAAFLLAFLLSSRLQQLISRPILYLVGVERRVTEGEDYSIRAEKQTEDEIGLLIDGFNAMLSEVEKRDASLRERGEELRQKNEQILDSIRYAQHIQESILPPAELLSAALPEHFVVFRPCHIVSGDFYWCHRAGGRTFLAVVDCTGHGVPGAFMSMIGGSLLRGIVVERGVSDPAAILALLDSGVRETLQQDRDGVGSQDGMDVCLCVLDEGTGSVSFAGAKRPLYVVRANGSPEGALVEVKGDRAAVGGRHRGEAVSFTARSVDAFPGDMLYLTTDGYSDQNGDDGRRFGAERFKALLRSIAPMPPTTQQATLVSDLVAHQGSERQRDDITIVGVRLPSGGRTP
jgi:serine phosphatase RsbU (regulator of sigma subunit)